MASWRALPLPSHQEDPQNQTFDIISNLAYYTYSSGAKLTGWEKRAVIPQC